jgi:tight adherence protein B
MSAYDASGWLAAMLLGGCAASCWAAVALSDGSSSRWHEHVAGLEQQLRYQGSAWTGRRVAELQQALIIVLGVLTAVTATGLPIAGGLLVLAAPSLVLRTRRRHRTERIEQQLDGFLIALAHSLRATPALGDALSSAAEVVAAPLSDELHVLLKEHDLGTPLDVALENMAERVQSPVVGAALSTLQIARSTGGDFVQTLERSAATLREMARLEGVVRTKTAEGRAQTVVVSALPLPTLWLIDRLSPKVLEPLWTTDAGHVLLMIALFIWLVSILAARRIVHVDI